jgi:hypothetical protein
MIPSLRNRSGWWLFAAAVVVTIAVYYAGLSGSWFFDDNPNIVDNPGVHIHSLSIANLARAAWSSPSSEFKRPLASITFALNYLGSGLNPYWWKVTNVAIHLINGVLVFLLARMLLSLGLPVFRQRGAAAEPASPRRPMIDVRHVGMVAALIAGGWMLLPINLTAVLYVVQRMESMANAFVLIGLIGYVMFRRRMLVDNGRYWRYFVGCIASVVIPLAIGFTAKETAVMLPLYAFLIEWVLFGFAPAPGRRGRDKALIGLYVVVLLLPLIGGLIWRLPHLFRPNPWPTRDFTPVTRLLSEARIVTDYIQWTLVPRPDPLSFYHDNYVVSTGVLTPWTTLPSILIIAALIALAIWLRKRAPLVSLGLLLFFGCQSLTATILPLELIYEHRNYFASFGLLLALVPILAAGARRVYGRAGAASAADVRNGSPSDARTPTDGAVERGLPLALPRYLLLGALMLLWIVQTAITAYAWGDKLRLAEALAARAPDSPRAEYELGRTYLIRSHYDPNSVYPPRLRTAGARRETAQVLDPAAAGADLHELAHAPADQGGLVGQHDRQTQGTRSWRAG